MSLAALPNFFVAEEPLAPPAFERLNEVAAPTLVIVGESDDALIKTIGEFLSSHIPGARKETISGAAHLPNMDKPDEFNQAVLAFLQQVTK